MKKQDLQPALNELGSLLEDMKTLLEWHKLKQFEAEQNCASTVRFYDTTTMDLKDKYSSFLSLASQIHAAVGEEGLAADKFKTLKKQLAKMEHQAYFLGSAIRF